MKKLKSLSIFFPAYNDAKSIGKLVETAYQVGSGLAEKLQVSVVNDGSVDGTLGVLKRLKLKHQTLNIIDHKANRGYGGALKSGFDSAKNDWIFYTDGDGQYDVRELRKLVKLAGKEVDVVNGYKRSRADSWVRVIAGDLYNFLLHIIYRVPVRDIDCDFRLIRSEKMKNIRLTSDSGLICLELILKLKKERAVFCEVEVTHLPRKYGRSQFFKFSHLFTTLKEHINFWKKNRRDI